MSIDVQARPAAASEMPLGPVQVGHDRLALLRYLVRREPFGCALFLLFVVTAVLGPTLAPYNPEDTDPLIRLEGPSAEHLLGTDQLGRDLLSRILGGAQIAAEAALIVLAVGALIGSPLGALAGTLGGRTDALLSRAIEVIQGFPVVILALGFVAVTGRSLLYAMIAVGIGAIPAFFRIARSIGIQMRSREFVEAARSYGASRAQIIRSEVMPNAIGALIVVASYEAAVAVMYESALSFIGIGAQQPTPSFGRMLFEAKGYLGDDPSYALFVGAALAIVILGLNLMGDALSDRFQGEAE
jgi:peptide/nickel transport system permease protein